MLPAQDQTSPAGLARRGRRARAWLAVTVALHVLMLALTVALLPLGRITQADSLVIIIVLAVAPLAGVLWWERRRPSTHQPHKWPWRSLTVAFPQGIALGFAVNAVLDADALGTPLRLLLILAMPLIPAAAAELARRSLLWPMVAELGAGDVEVLVEPRTSHRPWFYSDSIALRSREIVITVRSGPGRAAYHPKTERIALADVTAVGARLALPQDSPWITLSDGRGLSVPPGDVVVVQCGLQGQAATRVLPVADAAVFAGVIRTRVSRVRGTAIAALPLEVGEHPPQQEHLPELRPAPDPTGPVAHPVTGPVIQPMPGPGMVLRWGLGFPLALLGIVGVPIALLAYGGLLPPGTGLERARLGCCALWTALAAGIWLRSVRQPRYWPVWALTSGLTTAVVVAVQGPGWPALLGPIIGVLLTWTGRQILIRPVSADLAGSRLEIPMRLPGGATLLVQRDRMLLKVPGGGGGAVPQALPLEQLTLVQLGQFAGDEARFWPFPGARMRIGRGPVLRLVSGPQQWLIPVQAPHELAAIIRERAGATPARDTPAALTVTQWYELRTWAAQQLTKDPRAGGLRQRTVGFRLAIALPAAFLGTALISESIGRGAEVGSGAAVAGALLVVAMISAGDWIRVRRRLRVAEDNALPPGSPAWGELRADHVPLDGWQPWWEESRSGAPVGL